MMMNGKHKIDISESIGSVSVKVTEADQARYVMLLAHGAGAGMDHPFMSQLAKELATQGVNTIRFNFPFAEQKKGRPDFPAVAEKTVAVALDYAASLFPSFPLIAAGKSFGGRMSSHVMAKADNDKVKALVFYGFPLHAPGKPGILRAAHLAKVKIPMLFLQGTRDTLADLKLIGEVTSRLPLATLTTLDGADHGFKAGKREVIPELASITGEWLNRTI